MYKRLTSQYKGYAVLLMVLVSISCAGIEKDSKPAASKISNEIKVAATTMNDDPLPQSTSVLDDVTVSTDIAYSTLVGYRPLRLDLYAQTNNKTAKPAIVFVHGGGWTIGYKRATSNYESWPGVMANLARLGFVVVAVEYRLSGEAPFPAPVQDVKTAIRFLKANADKYGIDSNKVALWGGSAGANIAAMAAFTPDNKSLDPANKTYNTTSEKVNAFVGWYGPYDITEMIGDLMKAMGNKLPPPPAKGQDLTETAGSLLFFHCNEKGCPPDMLLKGSPVTYVNSTLPPTLLIHGTADTMVPHKQSEILEKKMREAGSNVELKLIDGVGHGWVGSTPELTKKGSLQAIDITFKYFDEFFNKK